MTHRTCSEERGTGSRETRWLRRPMRPTHVADSLDFASGSAQSCRLHPTPTRSRTPGSASTPPALTPTVSTPTASIPNSSTPPTASTPPASSTPPAGLTLGRWICSLHRGTAPLTAPRFPLRLLVPNSAA